MASFRSPCRHRGSHRARLAALAVTLAVTSTLGLTTLGWDVSRAGAAEGQGWPLDHQARTLLAFGSTYTSGAQSRTHTGCDLSGERGDEVLAPAAATVSFVGLVPSAPDRRVTAVTLERADGVKITLMPLASATARQGQHVAVGQRLGALAADGDPSCSETHLHVSARKGSLYVDPLGLLCAPSSQAPDATTPEPDAASEPSTRPDTAVTTPDTAPVAEQTPSERSETSPGTVSAPQASLAPASSPGAATHAANPAVAVSAGAGSVVAASSAAAGAVSASHAGSMAGGVSRTRAGHEHLTSTSAGARETAGSVAADAGGAARSGRDASAGGALSSLGMLLDAARTRDRLLPACVSYLLGTIAAAGLVGFAVRRVLAHQSAQVAVVPVGSE